MDTPARIPATPPLSIAMRWLRRGLYWALMAAVAMLLLAGLALFAWHALQASGLSTVFAAIRVLFESLFEILGKAREDWRIAGMIAGIWLGYAVALRLCAQSAGERRAIKYAVVALPLAAMLWTFNLLLMMAGALGRG